MNQSVIVKIQTRGSDANRDFNQNNNYFLLLTDTFKSYSDQFYLVKRQMEGRLALLE